MNTAAKHTVLSNTIGRLVALRGVLLFCLLALSACDECKRASDCGPGELCIGGKCRSGQNDTTDTSWPKPTDTGSSTETGSRDTSSSTETDSQTSTSDTDTGSGACNNPATDCPGVVPACQEYYCTPARECALRQANDGTMCFDPSNECLRGVCALGMCQGIGPVTGVPCANDGNECTLDQCEAGVCKHTATPGVPCSLSGNPCLNHVCSATGACGVPLNGAPCAFDTDPCTEDKCLDGVCTGKPINEGGYCDDGLWCNGREVCRKGVCTPSTPPCGVGNACAGFECTEPGFPGEDGLCGDWVALADDEACDDGIFCNGEDRCDGGQCLHEGSPCDSDVTACTLELCDEGKGSCVLANKPDVVTTCPDPLLCNGTEICVGGECLPGGPYCPTISDCLVKSCDENGGAPICGDPIWALNGALCSPTDPCLGAGIHRCFDGACADAETPACQPEDQDESFCSYYPICTPVGNLPFCNGPLTARDTDNPVDKSDPTDIFSRWFAVIDETPTTTDPLVIIRSFSTVSKNNDVTSYSGGACSGDYSGGDLVFQLDLSPGSNWRLEIATTGSTTGSELTLLLVGNPCAPSATCIESSTTHLDFTTPATGHYYVVVDGKNGNRGVGTLTLTPL